MATGFLLLSLVILRRIEPLLISDRGSRSLHISARSTPGLMKDVEDVFDGFGATVSSLDFRRDHSLGRIEIRAVLDTPPNSRPLDLANALRQLEEKSSRWRSASQNEVAVRSEKGGGMDAMRMFMPSFLVLLLAGSTPAFGQDSGFAIVDEWPTAAGKQGVPDGWTLKEFKGTVVPGDITVETDGDKSVLRLRANDKSYFLGKEKLNVSMSETPVLTWRWKTRLPVSGADARDYYKDDQSVNIFVTFKRGKEGKLRAIGYLWDAEAPRCGYIISPSERSFWTRKALRLSGVPITWYVVLRDKETPLDTWITESRNLAEDYRQIFKTDDNPDVVSVAVQTDTATLKVRADSSVGFIKFSARAAPTGINASGGCKELKALR